VLSLSLERSMREEKCLMSYNDRLLREFIRDCLTEKLGSPGEMTRATAEEITARQSGKTFFDVYGEKRAEAKGIMGTILNLLGQPESAAVLYGDFFGSEGLFNLKGIFGDEISPLGKEPTTVGKYFWQTFQNVMGPEGRGKGSGKIFSRFSDEWKNAETVLPTASGAGKAFFTPGGRVGTAAAGRRAARGAADVVSEVRLLELAGLEQGSPSAEEISDSMVDALRLDLSDIFSGVSKIKSMPTLQAATQAWHDLMGSDVDVSPLADAEAQAKESGEVDVNMAKSNFTRKLVPQFLSQFMDTMLSQLVNSSTSVPVTPEARAKMISMLEDAIGRIK